MRNIIAGIILLYASVATAQINRWKLSEISNDNKTVGYIYHTEATGIQLGGQPNKVVAGLRFICSDKSIPSSGPSGVIGIYWQYMNGYAPQDLIVKVDGNQVATGAPMRWKHEKELLYRSFDESRTLIQAMKTGRSIFFGWTGADNVRREVVYDLRTFNTDLGEFTRKCDIVL